MSNYGLNFPIDLTLFLGIILVVQLILDRQILFSLNRIIIFKQIKISFLFFTIFYIWILISNSWSPSNSYYLTKAINILTLFIALLWPILSSKFNESYFFLAFSIISAFFGLWFITFILPYIFINSEYYEIQSTYLYVSVISGVSLLMILTQNLAIKNYLKTLLIVGLLVSLVLSGGRSSIISFFGIILIWLGTLIFRNRKIFDRHKSLNFFFFGVVIFIFLNSVVTLGEIKNLFDRTEERILLLANVLYENSAGNSVDYRFKLLDFSYDRINSSLSNFLFGGGNGSFGILFNGNDVRQYPHNIIIEIFFEYGIIGLLLFSLFILSALKGVFSNEKIWLFIFLFLQALKSNDLGDQRILFAVIAINVITNVKKLNLTRNFHN